MNLPYNPLAARVQALAACLCAEIQDPENGVPDVCFCGVIPGDAAVAQYAGNCKDKCGMAWVRLASAYPANAPGIILTEASTCTTGMGADIEIGMLRCMTVGDERGNMPSPQEQTDAFELQMADLMVMWKAILCCNAFPGKDILLSQYQPAGPEGGLVGGTFTISILVV